MRKLKSYKMVDRSLDDEIYYFRKPIVPEKVSERVLWHCEVRSALAQLYENALRIPSQATIVRGARLNVDSKPQNKRHRPADNMAVCLFVCYSVTQRSSF